MSKVKSFFRDIVSRKNSKVGRMYRHEMRYAVIRTLSCGHEQVEKSGGLASRATRSVCLTCMKEAQPNPRDLFMPRTPELAVQCPSCPFLDGNDEGFGALTSKLLGRPATKEETAYARFNVRQQVSRNGEFVCHNTAYHSDGGFRALAEQRQCPGATKHFKASAPEVRRG